ncbi:hypothetical protein BGP_0455 [Beggiatoa sp. PS]|nr:hypothetical protein BGP_0455 [Beggiatoa sp. PS]
MGHWAYFPHYKGTFAFDPILPNGGDIFWREKPLTFRSGPYTIVFPRSQKVSKTGLGGAHTPG